ncbi:MAG: oligosaccharide flippase family protein [Lachnospiraceae bacterium]|jgi:O-antigen/teichoic acid export membrane protein|nr:oligosaccharide flippase family protein [Lachnospiraceae bacterium]
MEEINRKAIKAGFWYVISNFMTRGIAFITMPVFTRIMSKEEFGYYNNFSSWLGLLTVLTTLELYSSISRAKFDYKESFDSYVSSILLCGSAFTGICYIIVIIFQDFFVGIFNMEMLYVHMMFISLMVSPAIQLLITKNRHLLKYKSAVVLSLASTMCSTVFSLILVLLINDKIYGRIIGSTMPLVLFNLAIYIFTLYKGRSIHWNHCKYALAISVPLIPHFLAGNILGTIDRIIIARYCGDEDVALYSVVYSCSVLFTFIQGALNQAWSPWFYEQLHNQRFEQIKKISKIYIILFCLLGIAIMLIGPEVILVLGGRDYMSSIYLVPPIIMGCVYLFLYTLYVNVEIYNKKTLGISLNTIMAAVVNLVLNILLIPVWGYTVAAYTTLLGYFILLCAHYYACRKMSISKFYDNRFIFLAAAIMFLISLLILPLYRLMAVRYIIIVVCLIMFGILAWRYRGEIGKLKKRN